MQPAEYTHTIVCIFTQQDTEVVKITAQTELMGSCFHFGCPRGDEIFKYSSTFSYHHISSNVIPSYRVISAIFSLIRISSSAHFFHLVIKFIRGSFVAFKVADSVTAPCLCPRRLSLSSLCKWLFLCCM